MEQDRLRLGAIMQGPRLPPHRRESRPLLRVERSQANSGDTTTTSGGTLDETVPLMLPPRGFQ